MVSQMRCSLSISRRFWERLAQDFVCCVADLLACIAGPLGSWAILHGQWLGIWLARSRPAMQSLRQLRPPLACAAQLLTCPPAVASMQVLRAKTLGTATEAAEPDMADPAIAAEQLAGYCCGLPHLQTEVAVMGAGREASFVEQSMEVRGVPGGFRARMTGRHNLAVSMRQLLSRKVARLGAWPGCVRGQPPGPMLVGCGGLVLALALQAPCVPCNRIPALKMALRPCLPACLPACCLPDQHRCSRRCFPTSAEHPGPRGQQLRARAAAHRVRAARAGDGLGCTVTCCEAGRGEVRPADAPAAGPEAGGLQNQQPNQQPALHAARAPVQQCAAPVRIAALVENHHRTASLGSAAVPAGLGSPPAAPG